MQHKGMLDFFKKRSQPLSVPEFLEHSSYDELIEINLNTDRYRFIYNVADKYFSPITEGTFSEFYKYAVDHMVHPDEVVMFAETMNPDTLLQRMAASEPKDTWEWGWKVTGAGWIPS